MFLDCSGLQAGQGRAEASGRAGGDGRGKGCGRVVERGVRQFGLHAHAGWVFGAGRYTLPAGVPLRSQLSPSCPPLTACAPRGFLPFCLEALPYDVSELSTYSQLRDVYTDAAR